MDCYHSWTCSKASTDFDLPLWLFRSIHFASWEYFLIRWFVLLAADNVRVVFKDNFFDLKGHTAHSLGQVERGDLSEYENELNF